MEKGNQGIQNLIDQTAKMVKERQAGHNFLSPEDMDLVINYTQQIPQQEFSEQEIISLLMVFNFRFPPTVELQAFLKDILKNRQTQEELIVLCLQTTQKHVVDYSFQSGKKIEKDFFTILDDLLKHTSLSVQEWTLRIIEACQGQAMTMKKSLQEFKPPFLKINQTKKNVFNLHFLLKQRFKIK